MRKFTEEEAARYTVEQYAEMRGCSEKTVRRLIDSGALGCYGGRTKNKDGKMTRRGKILIGKSHIDEYENRYSHSLFELSKVTNKNEFDELIRLAHSAGLLDEE